MSDTGSRNGKVVANRSMSLDGFIAGPGDAMDWIFDFVAPDEFPEIAAATGAMLVGRRTVEVGSRMDEAKERGSASSGETYPFSGPVFVLTHRPPDPPDPEVTYLTGDIGKAIATALDAAGGKNLEILGADVAAQCLQRGLVDEILVYVLPVLLGDGIRFYPPGLARIDLEPLDSTRSGAVTILRPRGQDPRTHAGAGTGSEHKPGTAPPALRHAGPPISEVHSQHVRPRVALIIWHVLAGGVPCDGLSADFFTSRLDPERETRRLIAKLEALGHHVSLQPAA